MSRASSKHGREQALNFQGFLNDLQEWELSVKDKDKKFKQQESQKGKSKVSLVSEERQPVGKSASRDSTSNEGWYNHPFNYDALDHMSSSLMTRESTVDPASEKELGNEYFKQRKYNEAIDCYSRSIALSPTAVAYANRAMAYLKIKRFQEAEDDCTEALNLDDRYIKAYSRRATARKELGKLRDALEDAEFALKLEPNNPEVKKQFTDVKSLLGKAILSKAAGTPRDSVQGLKKVESKANSNHAKSIQLIPESSKKAELDSVPGDADFLLKKSSNTEETENKIGRDGRQMNGVHVDNSHGVSARASSSMENHGTSKQKLAPSVQELASRAASRAMMEAAKNISPPSSAYQFEVYWRGFSGDRSLQAQLLKVTPPATLPQIFKNALTAPILIDIIKCIATIFTDEIELAVKYLENLTKVPRFDMIIMCLPSVDKADLCRTWEEVFLSKATPIEYAEVLNKLHPRYCPR